MTSTDSQGTAWGVQTPHLSPVWSIPQQAISSNFLPSLGLLLCHCNSGPTVKRTREEHRGVSLELSRQYNSCDLKTKGYSTTLTLWAVCVRMRGKQQCLEGERMRSHKGRRGGREKGRTTGKQSNTRMTTAYAQPSLRDFSLQLLLNSASGLKCQPISQVVN